MPSVLDESTQDPEEFGCHGCTAEPEPETWATRDDGADPGWRRAMDDEQLAGQQPENIDEAIGCMQKTLTQFHERHDRRAVFLRLYYIMTLEVHAAINGLGAYGGRTVFLDPPWVERLSGKFASLYFRSLDTFGRNPGEDVERAWKIAYKVVRDGSSTVVQDALLGMNAHINYDLARAIASNLDPGELDDYPTLQRRKFDHDQVNNLLLRTLGPVQEVLARDYGPAIGLVDLLLGQFDERLSETGLGYYRERVWWDALTFAAAAVNGRDDVVRDKLNWESYKIALYLCDKRWLWVPERVLGLPWSVLGTKSWERITLEDFGGVDGPSGTPINVLR